MFAFIDQLFLVLEESLKSTAISISPDNEALTVFIFFVQWSALILSALAGLVAARRQGMDKYGALVISFVSAVGGGTLRDVLLGRYPIFWIAEPIYAFTIVFIVVSTFVVGKRAEKSKTAARVIRPLENLDEEESRLYVIVDSLALGLWAYLGTFYALQMGTPLIVAPIMGVITASFGGIIRDVLFARVPQQLLPGHLYVTAAAFGAVFYVILWWFGANNTIAFLGCFISTFLIRIASVKFNIMST